MTSLLLTLCISALGHASSLIVLSGDNPALDPVPRAILTSLEESGVVLEGEDNLRTLKVTSLQCKEDPAGSVDCSFALSGKEERQPVKNDDGLIAALRSLNGNEAGLRVESCGKDGSCEYSLAFVTCMVNTRMIEESSGKYGCGLVSL